MDYAKLIPALLIIFLVVALAIYNFMQKSKEEKINTVIHWLRAAVYLAEDEFGSGTGQLKLATVYNEAVTVFPWLASRYPYERFDKELVKPALEWLNNQIATNENIKNLLGL